MGRTVEGFDSNGRPDDLLARITFDKSVYQNAFLFAEGGEEGEAVKEKRNRFPKNENLELAKEYEKEIEDKQDKVRPGDAGWGGVKGGVVCVHGVGAPVWGVLANVARPGLNPRTPEL